MARAGIASRRAAEEMIAQGRVTVNGHIIREAGTRADPDVDRVVVDGQPLRLPTGPATVLLFHKPTGVVTTKKDPEGRTTVAHYLPDKYRHLHPVGRLDFDTSGVLLLSDDGDLTQLLTHPSHGVEKVYWARVRGTVTVPTMKKLEAGIFLEDGKTAPCQVRVRAQTEKNALIQVTLREGRNRQVRRMLEAVGHPARALRRVRFAGLGLDELASGTFRALLPGEIHALRKAAEKPKPARRAPAQPKRSRGQEGNEQDSAGFNKTQPGQQVLSSRVTPPRASAGRPGRAPASASRETPRARGAEPRQANSENAPGPGARAGKAAPRAKTNEGAQAGRHPTARQAEARFEGKRKPRTWGEKTRKHG